MADVAFRLAPLGRLDAHDLINDLGTQALLGGLRGEPAVDRDALADILCADADGANVTVVTCAKVGKAPSAEALKNNNNKGFMITFRKRYESAASSSIVTFQRRLFSFSPLSRLQSTGNPGLVLLRVEGLLRQHLGVALRFCERAPMELPVVLVHKPPEWVGRRDRVVRSIPRLLRRPVDGAPNVAVHERIDGARGDPGAGEAEAPVQPVPTLRWALIGIDKSKM